ncbi:limbic system-associated membrane protein-like [Gigantopelta aegis]|uniref:limbic system-associated membrane protein-like n=1 Tax=Gigantopelta aegis TaxID=1735272 RepID=UPI001B887D86|nr:limbic system-associated membrane protein-like [Gigantopelta aegis]
MAHNSKEIRYGWPIAHCEDSGNYSCTADNDIKERTIKKTQLFVRCSPRLNYNTELVSNVSVNVNEDTVMAISVIAYPAPVFTWYKLQDDQWQKLESTETLESTSWSSVGHLVINNAQWKDAGQYQVVVSNDVSSERLAKNMTLTLLDKREENSTGKYIGIAIGTVAIVAVLVMVTLLIIRRKRRAKSDDSANTNAPAAEPESDDAKQTYENFNKSDQNADDQASKHEVYLYSAMDSGEPKQTYETINTDGIYINCDTENQYVNTAL